MNVKSLNNSVLVYTSGYPEFGRHLNNTGRPMVYSCSWPAYQEEKGMLASTILDFEQINNNN